MLKQCLRNRPSCAVPPLHSSVSLRYLTSNDAGRRIRVPTAVPTVPHCPPPTTCGCAPAMPSGLEIDQTSPLNGTIAPYAEHVLVCTGRDDWPSRIEDDVEAPMAKGLKSFFGKAGSVRDPYHNVLITNGSFATPSSTSSRGTSSALLFPSFTRVDDVKHDLHSLESFVKAFVLPKSLHSMHSSLTDAQKQRLLWDEALQATFAPKVRPVEEVVVLICGHGGRDTRCGVLGPLLQSEFERQLGQAWAGYSVLGRTLHAVADGQTSSADGRPYRQARVGLVSHIGGHKWAGNVGIYVPPAAESLPTLAGTGIWYGRVRPEDVEGIVRTTLVEGKIIKDLYRGGVDAAGKPILL